jgi:MFS superfamily sulfate permease-like transporter
LGHDAAIIVTGFNVKASGVRTLISTSLDGFFLLIIVVAFGDIVTVIPMAGLAAMIFVCLAIFDGHSTRPRTLTVVPNSETMLMVCAAAATRRMSTIVCWPSLSAQTTLRPGRWPAMNRDQDDHGRPSSEM